jgi:predicted alpha/beta hydrolase family esterase
MRKQVFFLHSAGPQGSHEGSSDLVAWLQRQLGRDVPFAHPVMPDPDAPTYARWKRSLKQELGKLEGEIVLLGHSLGGSVLLKYLSEEPFSHPIAGMFLVATPFWGGDKDWHAEWMLPEDFATRLPSVGKVFLYHSKEDPNVPFGHLQRYAASLPQAKVREIPGSDHEFVHGVPHLLEDLENTL